MTAAAPPDEVAALQQAILRAMRRGFEFSRVHKEGGTTIRIGRRGFVTEDFGDSAQAQCFASEAAFLDYLRYFHEHEIVCEFGSRPVSEAEAWRLIHARLQPPSGAVMGPQAGWHRVAAIVLVLTLAFGLAWLKVQPGAAWRRPAAASASVLIVPPGGLQPDPARMERLRESERQFRERMRSIAGPGAR